MMAAVTERVNVRLCGAWRFIAARVVIDTVCPFSDRAAVAIANWLLSGLTIEMQTSPDGQWQQVAWEPVQMRAD